MVWSQLLGVISMELNGQFHNVLTDTDAYFDAAMTRCSIDLGIG
jgi:hypothetical protein